MSAQDTILRQAVELDMLRENNVRLVYECDRLREENKALRAAREGVQLQLVEEPAERATLARVQALVPSLQRQAQALRSRSSRFATAQSLGLASAIQQLKQAIGGDE